MRRAGGETILELWVPAEELAEFDEHIVGRVEVLHAFHADGKAGEKADETADETADDRTYGTP